MWQEDLDLPTACQTLHEMWVKERRIALLRCCVAGFPGYGLASGPSYYINGQIKEFERIEKEEMDHLVTAMNQNGSDQDELEELSRRNLLLELSQMAMLDPHLCQG
jgi:hypothetical protein